MTARPSDRGGMTTSPSRRGGYFAGLLAGTLLVAAGCGHKGANRTITAANAVTPTSGVTGPKVLETPPLAAPVTGLPEPPTLPADAAAPTRTAGIEDMHQGPFFGGVFLVNNTYGVPLGVGEWIEVYAGAKRDEMGNPVHAALRVYVYPLDPASSAPSRFVGEYVLPGRSNLTKILTVSGSKLMLSRDTEGPVAFDFAADSFG
jgi:hypothetical protein